MTTHRDVLRPRLAAMTVAGLLVGGTLAGCGDDSTSSPTTSGRADAASAAAQVEVARQDFCDATQTYVEGLDAYGRLFDQSALTVGDVTDGGDTLVQAEAAVLEAVEDYDAAVEEAVAAAEAEAVAAAEAEAAAAAADGSSTTDPATTTTFPPLAPPERVEAVQDANATFEEAVDGVNANMPIAEATIEVTSAAYALEVAWFQLFNDAGCIEDEAGARAQVSEYVSGLQTDLTTAGYFTGAVDGVYGPDTAEAVRQLQAAAGLPTTGTPDPATQRALNEALADQEAASIAALQGMLAGLGYYTGPIDGIWSDEVEAALVAFQTDAGQEPSGTVTIETLTALQQQLAGATTTTTAPAETTTTAPASPDGSVTTT